MVLFVVQLIVTSRGPSPLKAEEGEALMFKYSVDSVTLKFLI
jgi:hypothetical protein